MVIHLFILRAWHRQVVLKMHRMNNQKLADLFHQSPRSNQFGGKSQGLVSKFLLRVIKSPTLVPSTRPGFPPEHHQMQGLSPEG